MRLGLACGLAIALAACGDGQLTGDPDAEPTDCSPLPADGDGDLISDEHEGSVDSDGDGTQDWLDADSDGDGIVDRAEAGDTSLCTPPRDTDEDGAPDYTDIDSDGNSLVDGDEVTGDVDGDGFDNAHDVDDDGDGLTDTVEWGGGTTPVDSDGDGHPDYQDLDSDDDDVDDLYEGAGDADCDGLPSYLDLDADGDGIADDVEAPADTAPPLDSDADGTYDFLDRDADNDGLPDNDEDLDGDGVVGPLETNPRQADSDGDGYGDLIEWAAGPFEKWEHEDFFFVIPHLGPEQIDDLEFSTDIIRADVFFEVDTTGSMGATITSLQNSLTTVIVPQLSLEISNVAMGVGWFKDFPLAPFGGPGDLPFFLTQRITTIVANIQGGLNALSASGGGDGPESGMEAFYQALTGAGVDWPGGGIAKYEPSLGMDPSKGHGILGGAGFRVGALPIIVHITDAEYHDAPEYIAAGITDAHSRDDAVAAAQAMGARFIGFTSSPSARGALAEIAHDTKAEIPAFGMPCSGPFPPFPPSPAGMCPVMGGSVDDIAGAVKSLVTYGLFDISAVAVADPEELPGFDTTELVQGITPVPPAPPAAMIDGNVFRNVLAGAPVTFRIHARNLSREQQVEPQVYRVTIRVLADEVAVVDERDVFAIIPGGAQCE